MSCVLRRTSRSERRKWPHSLWVVRCPRLWSRSTISGCVSLTWRSRRRYSSWMLPCHRPASSATLSRAVPSSFRQHRSRLRQSNTYCFHSGCSHSACSSLWAPPCSGSRSHAATAAFYQAASWSRSQAGRPAHPGPRQTWWQVQVQEALRWPGDGDRTTPSPGGGPGGESFVSFCFCSVWVTDINKTSIKERFPQSLGLKRRRVVYHASRDHFPSLSPGSGWLPKSTPPAHLWNQARAVALKFPLQVVTRRAVTSLKPGSCVSTHTRRNQVSVTLHTQTPAPAITGQGVTGRLILAQSCRQLCAHRDLVLKHLSLLGLRVNWEKSKLMPTQRISFLGMELDSVNQTARLTQERAQPVLNCFKTLSGRTAVPLKLFSEAPGAYGCSCGDSPARSAPYEIASALPPWPNPEVGVEMRYSPGSDYTDLPQNLQPVVRSLIPSGRCAPGAGIQTCCGIHGCLGHRLGSHVQRARSIRCLDGSPTALANQLPRVAGSTPCLELPQRAPSAQGRSGPYGQHCDRCVYQPARRFTLPSHVATRPPPPPLESEFPSCHPHPRSVQSASRRAVLSSTEQAVQLIWGRFGAAQVDLFASPGVLLPNRGNARHGYTGTQLAPGPAQICLNDWRPVALTPIFSKCFEKLVREHICSVLPASLDPLQFVYRSNRSTDDAVAFTLHTALSHLENKNTYVRMLFMDYSSAFNTIVPATLVAKLQTLGLNRSLCSWILDFLTGRSQVVRMGNNTSSPLILKTGAPQSCVLSPLLYSLYTHDCIATHTSNVIVKFADDTTVIGLITDNDETAYREEVSTLTKGCQENHLSLNIDKTKELVVDYRRQSREHTPITIDKTPVERVSSFKFLGVHITEDLTWSAHTDAVLKKAHQRLFFLRRLRKFGTSPRVLRSFYTCTVESILTGCITAWFGNSTTGKRRALQRVVRTARHIVGGELPSLQDIYTRRCTRKPRRIIKDSSHPSHSLLSLLPSGRRFRSIRSRTSRLRDSFFPQAIRLMNSQIWPTLQHTPTHTTCHALHFNTVQLDYTHTLH